MSAPWTSISSRAPATRCSVRVERVCSTASGTPSRGCVPRSSAAAPSRIPRCRGRRTGTGPPRFEAGLQNYAGIVGLRHAIEYLDRVGREAIHAHEQRLTRQLQEGLARYPKVTIFGPAAERRGGITSFAFAGIDVHDVCLLLDQSAGIAVRSGRHCVHSWFNAHRIEGTVRASFYLYNTEEEVATFLAALAKVHEVLA